MSAKKDQILWPQIVSRVSREWDNLPAAEKTWITDHALVLVRLQDKLHQLFLQVDGEKICRECDGDCCGHGRFHPNLVNLLTCLVKDYPIPEPDFERDCPYSNAQGCLFPPGLRPYNCISFICGKIEDDLASVNLLKFYRLEKEIRAEYELFAGRYPAADMRGLLVKGEILPTYFSRCQETFHQ